MKKLWLVLVFLFASPAIGETYLLMAEQDGCIYCARWDADISPIYPNTSEGKAAPLRRYDIHSDPPQGVILARRVSFTPTFILVTDGNEVDRIEGYPGEDFFWGLLQMMLKNAGIELKPAG